VGASDDNNRGTVREKARLKPTISEEPSSGYAYHDESRVDTLRGSSPRPSTPRAPVPDNDTAPPKSKVAQKTMMGGFGLPSMGDSGAVPTRGSQPTAPRKPLSEPPEVGSWPPMPSVPPELAGTADANGAASSAASDEALETMPTDPPRGAAGGNIWAAVPSIHSLQPTPEVEERAEAEASSVSASPESRAAAPRISALLSETHEDDDNLAASKPIHSQSMRARISRMEVGYADVRLAKLDPMIERSAWEQVTKELSDARDLPPVLALLQVIARRELEDDKKSAALTREAIKALSTLLEVPENSPLALLLAKRLLRRNRATTQTQPSTGLSLGVVLGGLAIGAGVGWLVTSMFL
jgi:hypothetical protein